MLSYSIDGWGFVNGLLLIRVLYSILPTQLLFPHGPRLSCLVHLQFFDVVDVAYVHHGAMEEFHIPLPLFKTLHSVFLFP
jgi:hypothetical protein